MSDEGAKTFPCQSCGGDLQYEPGSTNLKCPYCGTENEIEVEHAPIEENDFLSALHQLEEEAETEEHITVTCESCAAELTFDPNVTASKCDYCGSDIVAQGHSTKQIKPASLLPFKLDEKEAGTNFKQWLNSRWFLPNKVKAFAKMKALNGVYIPFWTYDCNTDTYYTGQRGEHYWVTEHYTTTENGKTVTKTRQVRKTRWHSVSGRVYNSFNDILVLASRSLPKKYADELEPWDLPNLVPYADEYISGFKQESYAVKLDEGFGEAKECMDDPIRSRVRSDIGGDEQRIHSINVSYNDIMFKHILLPVWISSYRYEEKVYRFLVNARTGEVQGERPWSWVKITLLVLGIVLIVAIIAAIVYAAKAQ